MDEVSLLEDAVSRLDEPFMMVIVVSEIFPTLLIKKCHHINNPLFHSLYYEEFP